MFDFNGGCRALVLAVVVLGVVLGGCTSVGVRNPEAPATTTVFLVRHAEKLSEPGLEDPGLSVAGQQRAEALRERMGPHPLAALYTTDRVRTRATLAPLAAARGLPPQVYDARQPHALAALLRQQHPGQTVLVVGHSNTLLPLVEALGAPRPVPQLTDSDYDFLFEVTLRPDGTASVRAHRYGAGR